MFIPAVPTPYEGGIRRFPQIWHDTPLPDGDRSPWVNAPVGSLYVRVAGAPALFQKIAESGADTDWRGGSDGTINVLDYGADPTGTTGSGAAINAAIAAATASRYGRVYIPQGHYKIDETIVLDSLIWLQGAGYATYLRAADNLNAAMIRAYWVEGTRWGYMQRISDMRLDGNRTGQTDADASLGHGIVWDAGQASDLPTQVPELIGPSGTWPDTNRDAFNLFISYCSGDGFQMVGRGGINIHNVTCYENKGYGFQPTYDTALTNCTAARNGKVGFNVSVASCRLTNCKCWWSGYNPPTGWDTQYSHGYLLQHRGSMLVACEAQDNYAHGFFFNDAYGHVAVGCIADSNNRRQADDVGVAFKESWGNTFEGIVYDRYNDSIRYQPRALELVDSYSNRIRIHHRHFNGSVTNEAYQFLAHFSTSTNSLGGNDISINNYEGHQSLSGSSMSPSVYHGRNMRVSLGSNLSFNHNTASSVHEGAEMEINFFQSGSGGYTVTFDSNFDIGTGFTASGTVGHYSTIRFRWTGAKWVKTGEMIGV